MASNYNKVPRPPVVFVGDGDARGGGPAGNPRRSAAPRPVALNGMRMNSDSSTGRACSAAGTSAVRLVQLIAEQRRRHRRAHRPAARGDPRRRARTSPRTRPSTCRPASSPTTPTSVVNDPDVDVVVEVIGGIEPASPHPRPRSRPASRWSPATRSSWPTAAPSCSRPRPRPASTCCSRRRWPAASR